MSRKKRYDDAMDACLRASESMKGGADEGEYLPALWEAVIGVLHFIQKEATDQDARNLQEALGWSLLPHLRARLKAPGVVKKVSRYQQRLGFDMARHHLVERIRDQGVGLSKACEIAAEALDAENHPAGGVDHSAIAKSHQRFERDAASLPEEFWMLPSMIELPPLPDPTPILRRLNLP